MLNHGHLLAIGRLLLVDRSVVTLRWYTLVAFQCVLVRYIIKQRILLHRMQYWPDLQKQM